MCIYISQNSNKPDDLEEVMPEFLKEVAKIKYFDSAKIADSLAAMAEKGKCKKQWQEFTT